MFTTNPRISPDVRARLNSRSVVANAYARHTLDGGAKAIGTTRKTFYLALKHYGIRIRAKGEPPPGVVAEERGRKVVERATMRAYLKSDRCPPSCPGREYCLDGECTLREYC